MLSQRFVDMRSAAPIRGPRRILWLGAASFLGIDFGLCVAAGDYVALGWAVLLIIGISALAVVVSRGERRGDLVAIAVCAVALHMLAGIAIQSFSPTFAGGFVTGDDASYYRLASQYARSLQGASLDPGYAAPLWGGDAYLFGAFVYLEAGLFLIVGPDVRIPILLNCALAVVTALIVFDVTKRLFGYAAAIVAAATVAFFPSLLLWSALNLKDSLTITLAVLAVWAAVRFELHPRVGYFAIQFSAAEVLVSLRSYVAATIAIMALLSIALARQSLRRRTVLTALAAVLTTAVMVQSLNAIGSGFGEQLLVAFERERAAMAIGARTGFVATPSPVQTATSTFQTATSTPGASASRPTEAPTNSAVATITAAATAHPDDVAPAPGRTLSYLPTGLAYAIFAPFPLSARQLQEIAAAPEMVVWYLLVAAGIVTIWRERHRWRGFAPLVLAIGGLMLILALAEGNVGTLFRHRAMVITFAACLASPTLVALWAANRRRGTRAPSREIRSDVQAD